MYKTKRKQYYMAIGGISAVCVLIQIVVIATTDLDASYETKEDQYWASYYFKPYTRIHGYLIGMFLGCEYFRYKYECP
jgi:hypothetical protein